MTDTPSYEAAIRRNEAKAKAATKAMREAIINFDLNEARVQLQTEKQANAAVRRLRARQAKKMSVSDAVDQVLETMSVGSKMRLHTFIEHVSVTRGELDDGAALVNIQKRIESGELPLTILTLQDAKGDGTLYTVRYLKRTS